MCCSVQPIGCAVGMNSVLGLLHGVVCVWCVWEENSSLKAGKKNPSWNKKEVSMCAHVNKVHNHFFLHSPFSSHTLMMSQGSNSVYFHIYLPLSRPPRLAMLPIKPQVLFCEKVLQYNQKFLFHLIYGHNNLVYNIFFTY